MNKIYKNDNEEITSIDSNLFSESVEGFLRQIKCPICGWKFLESSYLKEQLKNPRINWFANMITHYRHNHLTSWNKCWGRHGKSYREGWFGDYDEEKQKVNERAKRQILRKCKAFLIQNMFTPEDLMGLQNNEEQTIKLALKILSHQKIINNK